MSNDNRSHYRFLRVPSTSSHYKIATDKINQNIEKYPQFLKIATAITIYPIQKWAQTARRDFCFSSEDVVDYFQRIKKVKEQISEKFDVSSRMELQDYNNCIEDTDKIIALVEECVEQLRNYPDHGKVYYEVMRRIHLALYTDEDITGYKMNAHYQKALYLICNRNYKRFDELISDPIKRFRSGDLEKIAVYHNTALLLAHYPYMRWASPDFDLDDLNDSNASTYQDCLRFAEIVATCAEMIKTYPINGKIMYDTLQCMLLDETNEEIAKKLNVTKPTIAKLRKEAIKAMSYLLWGYTTQDIIDTMCQD